MNQAQKTKAAMVEIALARLAGKPIPAGDAAAIQIYMALLTKREEAAFNKALMKALSPITTKIARDHRQAAEEAEKQAWTNYNAGRGPRPQA